MTYQQCTMARAALNWSRGELAREAGLAIDTVNRFERGQNIAMRSRAKMRAVLEAKQVKFVDRGLYRGAVLGPDRG
jgi:transcriptional regulator with XRE-family HTH domain